MFGQDYVPMVAARPQFTYPKGGSPEEVDWLGAKAQIDAAKAAGVKKVVFVGSMGGTQIGNFLNTMAGGNILLWKRKAEVTPSCPPACSPETPQACAAKQRVKVTRQALPALRYPEQALEVLK